MNSIKKVICIAVSLGCILGASSISAPTAKAAKIQGNHAINLNSNQSKIVNLKGTLIASLRYYFLPPGPNDPKYSYYLKTESGETYFLDVSNLAKDELAIYDGIDISIVGVVNSDLPSSIKVLGYSIAY